MRKRSEVKLVSIIGKLTAALLWMITRTLSYCPASPSNLLSHKRRVFSNAVTRSTPSSPPTKCLSTPSLSTLTPISTSSLCHSGSHSRPQPPTSSLKSRKPSCGAHQTSCPRSLVLPLNSSAMPVCLFISILSFPCLLTIYSSCFRDSPPTLESAYGRWNLTLEVQIRQTELRVPLRI